MLRAGRAPQHSRGDPRKWGPGKGEYGHEVSILSRPRRSFGYFPIGKVPRPAGRNPPAAGAAKETLPSSPPHPSGLRPATYLPPKRKVCGRNVDPPLQRGANLAPSSASHSLGTFPPRERFRVRLNERHTNLSAFPSSGTTEGRASLPLLAFGHFPLIGGIVLPPGEGFRATARVAPTANMEMVSFFSQGPVPDRPARIRTGSVGSSKPGAEVEPQQQ